MRSSNLTFEGYLADTTSVPSVRSFLFIVQVLFRVREDCVAHCAFLASSDAKIVIDALTNPHPTYLNDSPLMEDCGQLDH